jgi:hypothetical protein
MASNLPPPGPSFDDRVDELEKSLHKRWWGLVELRSMNRRFYEKICLYSTSLSMVNEKYKGLSVEGHGQ